MAKPHSNTLSDPPLLLSQPGQLAHTSWEWQRLSREALAGA